MNRIGKPLLSRAVVVAVFASQNVLAADRDSTASKDEPSARDVQTLDNVIVTGTRIVRPELESTMPIS